MADSSNDFLTPNVLVVPSGSVLGGVSQKGDLIISGAKLCFYTGAKWELVTSS